MTPDAWSHVYDLLHGFIVAGLSIGLLAAILATSHH